MTKTSFLGLLLTAGIITFTACKKEQMKQSTGTEEESVVYAKDPVRKTTSVTYTKFHPHPEKPWCGGTPGNCLPNVVVIGHPKYNEVANLIPGGSTAVGAYFSGSSWHSSIPQLLEPNNSNILTTLQSSNYFIEEATNATTGINFILIKLNGGPVTQDPTYVLQFDVN